MNCAAFEKSIALYVGNDIRVSERRSVETHLEGCAACRELANDLRESQSVFKALRSGAVNASALTDLRQRVLNEVGDLEPAPGWVVALHRLIFAGLRQRAAVAGFALAALVSGSLWFGQPRVVVSPAEPGPVAIARFEAPSAPDNYPLSNVTPRITTVRPTPKHSAISVAVSLELSTAELPAEPATLHTQNTLAPMKFLTDDPDIIIYWLPKDKGD
ncbi:MAG TPA: zf-HC2 domain-containing protein [Terriglobia bacterium]|nr:zf-HC2 domain-containing protein [Terriglobia bacterium]